MNKKKQDFCQFMFFLDLCTTVRSVTRARAVGEQGVRIVHHSTEVSVVAF